MTLRIDVAARQEVQNLIKRINEGDGEVVGISLAKFAIDESEQFVLVSTSEDSTETVIKDQFETENACYVLVKNRKLDSETKLTTWTLLTWIPDASDAHQRMLYASAKHSFRKQFNNECLSDTVHFTTCTEIDEFLRSMRGSKTAASAAGADCFLSNFERDLNSLKLTEAKGAVDRGIGTVTKTLSNLAMPLHSDLVDVLKSWAAGESTVNYLRIQIDLQSERMLLIAKETITANDLPNRIPNDGACYHLFNFVHDHNDNQINHCNVFIYSMAGYANCPLKHRMLYSTYKNFLVSQIESYGITITKKLEIENGAEVTETCLRTELYPNEMIAPVKKSFSKPATPSNRGPRRIIK